jgi:hypothetical protein
MLLEHCSHWSACKRKVKASCDELDTLRADFLPRNTSAHAEASLVLDRVLCLTGPLRGVACLHCSFMRRFCKVVSLHCIVEFVHQRAMYRCVESVNMTGDGEGPRWPGWLEGREFLHILVALPFIRAIFSPCSSWCRVDGWILGAVAGNTSMHTCPCRRGTRKRWQGFALSSSTLTHFSWGGRSTDTEGRQILEARQRVHVHAPAPRDTVVCSCCLRTKFARDWHLTREKINGAIGLESENAKERGRARGG